MKRKTNIKLKGNVKTNGIARYIARELNMPYKKVMKVLCLEHSASKKLVTKGYHVIFTGFAAFTPCIRRNYSNNGEERLCCSMETSNTFLDEMKEVDLSKFERKPMSNIIELEGDEI